MASRTSFSLFRPWLAETQRLSDEVNSGNAAHAARLDQLDSLLTDRFEAVSSRLDVALSDLNRKEQELRWHYEHNKRTMDWYVSAGSAEIQKRALDVMRLLTPMKAEKYKKVRMGSKNDGGYVCLDDFEGIDTAFSCGVERNADWDLDAAAHGLTVYQFDHTIDAPPIDHPQLIWERLMIAPESGSGQVSIEDLIRRWDKGHARPNLIMKMDIEGSEWPVINATPSELLKRFSQIVCELHSFDYLGEKWQSDRLFSALSKLNLDYGAVHVHANNHCGFANVSGVMVPMVLEVTFANRSVYELSETTEIFPGPLDAPCDPWRPDLHLGPFKY